MINALRRGLAAAILLLALPLWAAEPVRIGVLAFRPKPQTLAQWQPLGATLKSQMPDRDFVIEPLDYLEVEEAVASRRIDFVLTNSGHYVFLAHRSGLSSPSGDAGKRRKWPSPACIRGDDLYLVQACRYQGT